MQKSDDQKWSTSSLRQLLGKYISPTEMAGGDGHVSQRSGSNSSDSLLRPCLPQHRLAEGLLAVGNQQVSQPKCVYCEQNHWSDECSQYKSLQNRK